MALEVLYDTSKKKVSSYFLERVRLERIEFDSRFPDGARKNAIIVPFAITIFFLSIYIFFGLYLMLDIDPLEIFLIRFFADGYAVIIIINAIYIFLKFRVQHFWRLPPQNP